VQSQGPRRIRIQVKGRPGRPLGVLGTLVVAVMGTVALVAGLFLSVFLLAAFAGIAVVAGAWFWWRTRKLRRQFNEAVRAAQQAPMSPPDDRVASGSASRSDAGSATGSATGRNSTTVIEGDYIRRKDG
jgi:hypothetical protein